MGPGHVREGRPAISVARDDRTRFRYAEACGPWLYIHGDNRTGPGSAPPSAAPYPGHTAGPVLQHRPSEDTNQALDRARTASDMIKINNSTSENKPPWWLGELSEPTRTSPSGAPAGAVPAAALSDTWTRLRRGLAAAARAVPLAGRVLLSWLAAFPRRPGRSAVRHE